MMLKEKLKSRNETNRDYSPLVNPNKPQSKSPTIGISHKYVKTRDNAARSFAELVNVV